MASKVLLGCVVASCLLWRVDNLGGSQALSRFRSRSDVDAIVRELLWAGGARVLSLRGLRIFLCSPGGLLLLLLPVRLQISAFVFLHGESL
jgi:hypothetical protein